MNVPTVPWGQRLWLLALISIWSCSASVSAPPEYAEAERASGVMAATLAGAAVTGDSVEDYRDGEPPTVVDTPGDPPAAQPQRLVHYNGFARIRRTLPEKGVERAVALCEEAGGYVEKLAGLTVTLRVPVAKFHALFDQALELGDVLERSTTAQDVTEAFTELQMRLRTLIASRDRLVELLAKARTEQEKLQLLREIKRLTEQVDQLEMQRKTLVGLASFSRIALMFEAKRPGSSPGRSEPIAAFRWIRQLSPFRRDVAHRGDYLELEAPTGMVALDDREHWMAESADGAVLWTASLDNDPEGDADFWLEAIRFRLEPAYHDAAVSNVGEYRVLRLNDVEGYHYVVAVRVEGDELHVVEVYYPSDDQEVRYHQSVIDLLKGGVS